MHPIKGACRPNFFCKAGPCRIVILSEKGATFRLDNEDPTSAPSSWGDVFSIDLATGVLSTISRVRAQLIRSRRSSSVLLVLALESDLCRSPPGPLLSSEVSDTESETPPSVGMSAVALDVALAVVLASESGQASSRQQTS